jgi:hypothetical protein
MDLDKELLALAGGDKRAPNKRRKARYHHTSFSLVSNSKDDSDSDVAMSSESDEEFTQVKKWGEDLMGDAADRRRYFLQKVTHMKIGTND